MEKLKKPFLYRTCLSALKHYKKKCSATVAKCGYIFSSRRNLWLPSMLQVQRTLTFFNKENEKWLLEGPCGIELKYLHFWRCEWTSWILHCIKPLHFVVFIQNLESEELDHAHKVITLKNVLVAIFEKYSAMTKGNKPMMRAFQCNSKVISVQHTK